MTASYHKNYNRYLDNSNNDINKWKLIPLKTKVLEHNNFKSEREAKKHFGEGYSYAIQKMIEDFAFSNADNVVSIRDLHKPTQQVKELQDKSRVERDKFFVYTKQDGENSYIINGGSLAFYSTKIRRIDGKDGVTELLTNFWDHISWAGIAREGGVSLKNGKKPEKLLKQILELNSDEHDIVLDYHLGSGTTCAVAHKMNRQYIGIEQLDYDENDATVRLKNVIDGDKTGVSSALNWQGGGSFIYMELAKNNQKAKEEISKCKNYNELIELFDKLYSKYFLHYNVRINEFKNSISKEKNFKKLSLERQKEIFCRMLDNNQLYVHAAEMEDKQFGLSKDNIRLTRDFYQL